MTICSWYTHWTWWFSLIFHSYVKLPEDNSEKLPACECTRLIPKHMIWSSLDRQHRGNGEACSHTSQDASWHLPPEASAPVQASHGSWDTRYKWHRKRSLWSWWRDHEHLSRTRVKCSDPTWSGLWLPTLEPNHPISSDIIPHYHCGWAKHD